MDVQEEFDSPTVFFFHSSSSLIPSFDSFVGFSGDDIIENLLDNGGAVASTACVRTAALTHPFTHISHRIQTIKRIHGKKLQRARKRAMCSERFTDKSPIFAFCCPTTTTMTI